jgi:hypothetical protein
MKHIRVRFTETSAAAKKDAPAAKPAKKPAAAPAKPAKKPAAAPAAKPQVSAVLKSTIPPADVKMPKFAFAKELVYYLQGLLNGVTIRGEGINNKRTGKDLAAVEFLKKKKYVIHSGAKPGSYSITTDGRAYAKTLGLKKSPPAPAEKKAKDKSAADAKVKRASLEKLSATLAKVKSLTVEKIGTAQGRPAFKLKSGDATYLVTAL